jgi:hypothetical protein
MAGEFATSVTIPSTSSHRAGSGNLNIGISGVSA